MVEYNFPINTKTRGWHWVKFRADTGNKYEALRLYREQSAETVRAYDLGQCWSCYVNTDGTLTTR